MVLCLLQSLDQMHSSRNGNIVTVVLVCSEKLYRYDLIGRSTYLLRKLKYCSQSLTLSLDIECHTVQMKLQTYFRINRHAMT